ITEYLNIIVKPQQPSSTLFPYTTLFRSSSRDRRCERSSPWTSSRASSNTSGTEPAYDTDRCAATRDRRYHSSSSTLVPPDVDTEIGRASCSEVGEFVYGYYRSIRRKGYE